MFRSAAAAQRRRRRAPALSSNISRSPPNGPSQLKTNLEHTHQFRFVSTSATPTAITDSTLVDACGVVAFDATNGYNIRNTVRVNQVEIWTPPASQGASATCSVLWPATQRSQAREITDTTVSVATPAHVNCGPPANSLASFWVNGSASIPMFTLTAPVGSIIDVWISMVDGDGEAPTVGATLVGATTGTVYYCCLDSVTNATGIYKPVGLSFL